MSDHEQRAGDVFTATWTPKRTADLKPGVQDWIARNQPGMNPCVLCGSTDMGKPCPKSADGFHSHAGGGGAK